MAANAALRPRQTAARSAASTATRTSTAPCSRQSASTRARSSSTWSDGPVELDDQHRAAAGRVAGVDGRLGRLDRDRVHHLDRRRQDPGRDRARHRCARGVRVREAGEQRSHRLGRAQHAQRQLRRDTERALGAHERAEQTRPVVPDRELDELAVRQDDLRGEHVVDGEAVLEAVCAARVLGDVAADRAHLLRGRIGRVEEAVARDGARDVEVRHARLDDDLAAVDVDREHAVHPRERDDDPVRDRERAAREPRSRAARDEGDALLVADADDRLHLGGASPGARRAPGRRAGRSGRRTRTCAAAPARRRRPTRRRIARRAPAPAPSHQPN